MPHVEVTRRVAAPVDQVYAVCRDTRSFPSFMENVEAIEVLEEGPGWQVSRWVTNLQGRRIEWVERDTFDDAARCIRYQQVSGDLKRFEGEWRFTPADGGAETDVTLTCDFEFGIPMLAAVLNSVGGLAIRRNVEAMLDGVEARLAGGA